MEKRPSESNCPPCETARSTGMEAALAGGIAGSVAKTATAPLSRITILCQVQSALPSSHNLAAIGSSDNLISLTRRIIKTEGVLALWKGNLTSVIHRFPYSSINFASYEICRTLLTQSSTNGEETPFTRFVCGAIAGGAACFAVYPLDLIRTRLTIQQHDYSSKNYGIVNSFKTILRQEGVGGLYRGLNMSLLVSVPNLAVGFSVYGTLKAEILRDDSLTNVNSFLKVEHRDIVTGKMVGNLTPLASMLVGATSGIMSSLIVFPADVIRRRMQVRGLVDVGAPSATGEAAAFEAVREVKEIFLRQGIRGFYAGIVPELLKVTPMVAITFSVYEHMREFLHIKLNR